MAENFLFITKESLISDVARACKDEGKNVKYYIESEEDSDIADGFVEKVKSWQEYTEWADVIIFDDTLGQGEVAQKLRAEGKAVVGGTPYTDQLEDDRAFGQAELKKYGINIIPQKDFTSFDEAIDFVKENPNKYVLKPSGQAGNLKGLLFVGQESDGSDMLQVLRDYKQAWEHKIPSFQMQRRVEGVEVAVGAFFNGHEFMEPINVNFENKKLFPGNLGPSTGEMGCYDDKTEVLTENGWKTFEKLQTNEKICTLNPQTHEIEYYVPDMVVSFSHHKKLIHIQNQTIDVMVTPDHNMYVASQQSTKEGNPQFKFVKAQDLEHQCLMPRTGIWKGIQQEVFILHGVRMGDAMSGSQVQWLQTADIEIPMQTWSAFMGIWLAEGFTTTKQYQVGVCQKKGTTRDEIRTLLAKLPFPFKEHNDYFYCYDKQLWTYLNPMGKAREKYVPSEIKKLSTEQIKEFLKWFCKGDGTLMRNGHRIFYTGSEALAGDIQELLLKIGRVGVVKTRNRPNSFIRGREIDCSKPQYEIHERVKKGDSWLDRRNTKTINYDGKVWCATVQNHIMYVRRNGKPYFCGNTFMYWSDPNRMFLQTLKKFEEKLAEEEYVGYIDLNCIVNGNGIYPLEFTSRFGYPTIFIQQEGINIPINEFMAGMADGSLSKFKTKTGFQIGVRLCVPPFPFTDPETFAVKSKDTVIHFKKGFDGAHIEDVKSVNGEWVITGSSGVVMTVTGSGTTMQQAQQQVYNRIKNIIIPHVYYRDDIGERWYNDRDKLHNWGYLR